MEKRKEKILTGIRAFARQRPGLEFGNYGSAPAYRAESRAILRDLHDAETLLSAVAWRDSITADDLLTASKHAYSGRLTITEADGSFRLNYCTGQYFPTEYRRAVCAVLASALWDWRRSDIPGNTEKPGDVLRQWARKEFGARIQKRWFS